MTSLISVIEVARVRPLWWRVVMRVPRGNDMTVATVFWFRWTAVREARRIARREQEWNGVRVPVEVVGRG